MWSTHDNTRINEMTLILWRLERHALWEFQGRLLKTIWAARAVAARPMCQSDQCPKVTQSFITLAASKDDHLKMFIASIPIHSHERYKSMQVTKHLKSDDSWQRHPIATCRHHFAEFESAPLPFYNTRKINPTDDWRRCLNWTATPGPWF